MLRVDTSNISPLRHSVSSQPEKEIIFVLNFPAITRNHEFYVRVKVDNSESLYPVSSMRIESESVPTSLAACVLIVTISMS